MLTILTYIATTLIVIAFLWYLLLAFASKKPITDSNGFNVTKDILSEYDSINIVENKSMLTTYNLKRKVIKIASRRYYGHTLSDIAIPLMEAGISASNDKHLNIFNKIINNLKSLYVLPIAALALNNVSYNLADARVSIPILLFFTACSYMLISIKNNAYSWLDEHINKDLKIDKERVLRYINKLIMCDHLILYGELVLIIRLVAIMLNIK